MELTNIIGTGAQATVYREGNLAYKLFKDGTNKTSIFYEAFINAVIETSDLPIAKVYEILEINGQLAIKMDYINGKSLIEYIMQDTGNVAMYVEKMVDLQIEMHSKKTSLSITMHEKLKEKIDNSEILDNSDKQKLFDILSTLPHGNSLCHGDFHGYNIIVDDDKYYIIDWLDATVGCAEGDVCRTYLLYSFYAPDLAEMYLNCYCEKKGIGREQVLVWLPVIAGARLSEGNSNETDKLLSWVRSE